jgi:ribosomal protein S18 acetylase RimI-like enzyme
MGHPLYHFEVITEEGGFVGFILWWGFDDVRYIEHLATAPRLRGKGYGRRILEKFVAGSSLPVLLEVERPVTEMNRRRIGFYRRIGFVLNGHAYRQPPYRKGGDYVPLMLMTYPEAISGDAAARFCRLYHPVIYEFT